MFNQIMGLLEEAVKQDLANPAIRAQLRRNLEHQASMRLGIDVRGPLVKSYWDKWYNAAEREALGFIGVAETDPDETGKFIKEQAVEKVDTFVSALKHRLADKAKEQE